MTQPYKRLTPHQLDHFSLISERTDLNHIAGGLDLLVSQFIDANEGSVPRPLDDETLIRWTDAVSYFGMSVRRVIGQLESRESEISGKPPSRPIGKWDFWEGRANA